MHQGDGFSFSLDKHPAGTYDRGGGHLSQPQAEGSAARHKKGELLFEKDRQSTGEGGVTGRSPCSHRPPRSRAIEVNDIQEDK